MSESNEKRPTPVIFGVEGTRLTQQERLLFRKCNPFGFILFKRNCENPDQIRYLILEMKQWAGREDVQILIDQEGGRVARLGPPHWPKYPSARAFGMMYERDADWGIEAVRLYAKVLAHELVSLGITINCAPVVDLYNPDGTPALGDRAFSSSPEVVAALARAQAEVFLANGLLPVMKHLPGHGRMKVDPHQQLPVIDATRPELEGQDFVPFQLLKDLPLGMNSHAVFKALDRDNPVSLSAKVTNDIIRGKLGFDGLLLSDDLAMGALKEGVAITSKKAIDAGNDVVLHCSANLSQMEAIAQTLGSMSETSWARWTHARDMVTPLDSSYLPAKDAERLDVLLGGLAFENVA